MPKVIIADALKRKSADVFHSIDASMNGQSNLALKGIIGIAAMAEIARIAGVESDKSSFNVR